MTTAGTADDGSDRGPPEAEPGRACCARSDRGRRSPGSPGRSASRVGDQAVGGWKTERGRWTTRPQDVGRGNRSGSRGSAGTPGSPATPSFGLGEVVTGAGRGAAGPHGPAEQPGP